MPLKFKILQENFQKALEAVGPAASSHSTINSLYGVLITAQAGELVLSATDLELRIDARAASVISQEGQALVKYQTLHNQVRSLPSEPVEVELVKAYPSEVDDGTQGRVLSLSCGHASARLHCEDASTFPTPQGNDRHIQAAIPVSYTHLTLPTKRIV